MARRRVLGMSGVAGTMALLTACSNDAPSAICRFEDAPEAGLAVAVGSDTYFYADNQAGTQVGYERGGELLALEPGPYHARLNGSRYPVTVRSGQVTTCVVATVEVRGTTDAYYYVLDTLGTQLTYAKLGEPISIFPGSYVAKLNNALMDTELSPGDTTALVSGTVLVTGTTDEYYYVLDAAGTQLTYAKLGQPISLLAGNYLSKVNNSVSPLTLEAGGTRELASGTVLGSGTTDQYYYVLDTAGTQLGYARLGNALAYLPGTYRIRMVDTDMPLSVQAEQVTEVVTGTLVVQGTGAEYYYMLDEGGNQLGYSRLNSPTSLLAGTYSVRTGDRNEPVTIVAGRTTSLTR